MPLFIAEIAADTHNAEERDDGTGFNDGTYPLNWIRCHSNSSSASRWNCGMWWDNVTVPNGAWIRDAWVSFLTNTTKGDDFDATWYCEDVDDSANFVTTADVTSRTTTTASADFDIVDISTTNLVKNRDGTGPPITAGSWYRSGPDITACVQEVVDRGSWSSGNAMCVIVKGNSGTNRVGSLACVGTYQVPPKLYISYTDDADETRPVNTVWVDHNA